MRDSTLISRSAEPWGRRLPPFHHGMPGSVWVLVAVVAGGSGALSFLRARRLLAGASDLGFYVQDLYAIRAGLWRTTLYGFQVFSDHVSLILIPFAYLVGGRFVGEKLVILQSVVVALGVLPAYKLGLVAGGKRIATLTTLWYVLSAAVWHALLYDFHPGTLVLPLGLWLLMEIERDRPRWYWLPLLGIAVLREDMLILYGLAVLVRGWSTRSRSMKWVGSFAVLTGVGFFLWMGSQEGVGNHFWYMYGFESLGEVVLRPVSPDVLVGVVATLGPMLIVPAIVGWKRSWPGMLLISSFALSSWSPLASISYHYYAQSVPFLIAGAAWSWRQDSWAIRTRLSTTATASIFLVFGPLFYFGYGLPDRFASEILKAEERTTYSGVLDLIPPEASVSATFLLVAPLAYRAEVHPFPGPLLCGNSLGYYTPSTKAVEFVALERGDLPPEVEDWEGQLQSWGYEMIAGNELFTVWRLRSANVPRVSCPSFDVIKEVTYGH